MLKQQRVQGLRFYYGLVIQISINGLPFVYLMHSPCEYCNFQRGHSVRDSIGHVVNVQWKGVIAPRRCSDGTSSRKRAFLLPCYIRRNRAEGVLSQQTRPRRPLFPACVPSHTDDAVKYQKLQAA